VLYDATSGLRIRVASSRAGLWAVGSKRFPVKRDVGRRPVCGKLAPFGDGLKRRRNSPIPSQSFPNAGKAWHLFLRNLLETAS
jgi:hypothetical protein